MISSSLRLSVGVVVAGTVLGTIGCSDSKYTTVTGIVTLEDAPLADANIIFVAPGRPMATARTDESGRFRVETGGASGVEPGQYAVTVAAYAPPKEPGGPRVPKLITPRKYATPESSGLTASIAEGEATNLTFALDKS